MSETNTKQLITDWDAGMSSSTAITNEYEYMLDEIERLGWLTKATQQLGVAGTASYTMPATTVRLLRVFWDDRELFRETRQTMRHVGETWRDAKGTPVAFLEDGEIDQTFRLWPAPDIASDLLNYPNGEPFGRDYPRYVVVNVSSDRDDATTWLDVPAALITMARTREIESESQDLPMANALRALSTILIGILSRA